MKVYGMYQIAEDGPIDYLSLEQSWRMRVLLRLTSLSSTTPNQQDGISLSCLCGCLTTLYGIRQFHPEEWQSQRAMIEGR
jgi:hypothetical protein